VTVDTSNPSRPIFTIHEDVAWDNIEFDDELAALMAKASAVCFGTLAQRNPQSRETIGKCLQAAHHALIVYDVNIRQHWYERDWIESSMRAADIVKLNIDEVAVLADVLETGPADPRDFADVVCGRFGVQMVCITRAEDGCMLATGDETVEAAGLTVEVADAVGAGDAFTAALIFAHLQGWPLSGSADFANRVGALVASQTGAMPFLADEYRAIISDL